ncbi:MAG: hypothetical protein RLY58_851 [Pseudomonadota bacterium]|jgi:hypothetical protein
MNPLQRAKQHIEETVERRRREQQERLNSRLTAADHGRVQEAYQTQPVVMDLYSASGVDRECASPSHTATDTGSSSSSDNCSFTSSSSDY